MAVSGVIPGEGLHHVLACAVGVVKHQAVIELRLGVALFRGLLIPAQRLSPVLPHAQAQIIKHPQVILRLAVARRGPGLEQAVSGLVIPLLKGLQSRFFAAATRDRQGGQKKQRRRQPLDQTWSAGNGRARGSAACGRKRGSEMTTGGNPTNAQALVGARGFEPPTPATPLQCATRLRHAPVPANIAPGDCGLTTQQLQNLLELGAQLTDDLLTLIRVFPSFLPRQTLASAADGEPLLIQQTPDLPD